VQGTDRELRALAEALAGRLGARGWSVATAESCTGGWIAKALTDVAGSSQWFGFGFVSYSNDAKSLLLDVPAELIASAGAVSEPVVRLMAQQARIIAGVELAVAVSGIAGPEGGTPEKPVGTVWLAWAEHGVTRAERRRFTGGRDAVRRLAVAAALEGLLAMLDERGSE
jgi:nicotinamide-nucleotide amidase